MKKMKYNLYEMMGKLDQQYGKVLQEQRQEYHGAVPYEQLPDEDKQLFDQLFDIKRMRKAHMLGGVEGNYIDTKEIRFWDDKKGQEYKDYLNQKVEDFNNKSQSYNMEITDYTDWEKEPGERFWNARYTFVFIPK